MKLTCYPLISHNLPILNECLIQGANNMPPTTGETILEQITENVLDTRFENIGRDVIDNTKRRILDMIGCGVGGARGTGNTELAQLVRKWGGRREASILGYGFKVPTQNAAMVNCVFGRTYDRGPLTNIIDGKRFPNHTTETTVLTALALAESKGIDGKELITSIIVGDDLSARLHIASDRAQPGQAVGPGEAQSGLTRGTSDNFGATAIAGRLLGLNRTQMKNAFGVTAIMIGGGGSLSVGPPAKTFSQPLPEKSPAATKPEWLGVNDPFFITEVARGSYEETTSVKLAQGLIAQRGVVAAQLAQIGWTGVKDAFFGVRGGYYPGIESVNCLDRVTAGLGKTYYVEQVFKPYPGGKPTHAPTDAALEMARKRDINVEEIAEIILHLSPRAAAIHYSKPYIVGEYPTMNALWSYYYAVASALLRKVSNNDSYTEESIRDPRVQELIKKVRLADLAKSEGVELEVIMQDGRTYCEYVRMASGEPAKPMTRDDLVAKFKQQFQFSQLISLGNVELLISKLENLEEVQNVREIVELAVKA
jgi:2-methylcitrate dehydratase PrpD